MFVDAKVCFNAPVPTRKVGMGSAPDCPLLPMEDRDRDAARFRLRFARYGPRPGHVPRWRGRFAESGVDLMC